MQCGIIVRCILRINGVFISKLFFFCDFKHHEAKGEKKEKEEEGNMKKDGPKMPFKISIY
jgi:hypothetical protein